MTVNFDASEIIEKKRYIDKISVKKEIIENKYFTYTHNCRICEYHIKIESVNRSATKIEVWDKIREHIILHFKSKINVREFSTKAVSLIDDYIYIENERSEEKRLINEDILWLAEIFLENDKRKFMEEVYKKYERLSMIDMMKPYIKRTYDSVQISIDELCSLLSRFLNETLEDICKQNLKIYYDNYLKEENEDICQRCKDKLKFYSSIGYSKVLSSVHQKSFCDVCYNLEQLKQRRRPDLMSKNEKNFWNFLESNLHGEFIYIGSPSNSGSSILGYTPNFLHIKKKIAIELGDVKRENYGERQEKCKECNITLLGFENDAIYKNTDDIISIIKNTIK